jgi:hypothetical protein
MSECATDPEGEKCIRYGNIKQVPGTFKDILNSNNQLEMEALNKATGEDGQLYDIAAAIRVRLLDLSNAPLPLHFELSPQTNPGNFTPEPTPTPSGLPPDDPSCTGGNPNCTCPGPSAQLFASTAIKPAIAETITTHPAYFIAGGNEIVTGNERLVLQAVCDTLGGSGLCHPHPSDDQMIVLDMSGVQVSFRIITSDGFVRLDGGTAVSQCTDNSM